MLSQTHHMNAFPETITSLSWRRHYLPSRESVRQVNFDTFGVFTKRVSNFTAKLCGILDAAPAHNTTKIDGGTHGKTAQADPLACLHVRTGRGGDLSSINRIGLAAYTGEYPEDCAGLRQRRAPGADPRRAALARIIPVTNGGGYGSPTDDGSDQTGTGQRARPDRGNAVGAGPEHRRDPGDDPGAAAPGWATTAAVKVNFLHINQGHE